MFFGFMPILLATLRIAARSASKGTPVKSCSTTRATTKGISSVRGALAFQFATSRTCSGVTRRPSQLRSTDSSTMRIDTGSRGMPGISCASAGNEKKLPVLPAPAWKVLRVRSNACVIGPPANRAFWACRAANPSGKGNHCAVACESRATAEDSRRPASAVLALEVLQVGHQGLHAFQRHGVVDRRPHAAHDAVALELDHAARLGAVEEGGVQGRI